MLGFGGGEGNTEGKPGTDEREKAKENRNCGVENLQLLVDEMNN